jgi:hypothetical protein
VNLLENKLADLAEQTARSLNALLWGDGVADAKAMAGIRALVTDAPATGLVGGIDRSVAANSWWRNVSNVATPVTVDPANGGAVITGLQNTFRQLTRYGGRPTHMFAGSAFLQGVEQELRANGNYTMNGFTKGGDVAVGSVSYQGTEFVYTPTLDDLGYSKRGYWLDLDHIFIMAMSGEWRHRHNPARPRDQFVYYSSMTYTGQTVANQLNSSAVLAIA